MKKAILSITTILVFIISANAQIKLFSHGSIAIGGTTDPGSSTDYTKFYDRTIFDLDATFNDETIFDEKATFNKKPQFTDGLSVNASTNADFYSTTTFYRTVDFGQYGSNYLVEFYGDIDFQDANPSADFDCFMPAEFQDDLIVYGDFMDYSDLNLKTKINIIDIGSLEKVVRLQGVTYNYKKDELDHPLRSGFLAQDLQIVFPDLVVEREKGLAIKSLELIPYLVEAIKEQQEKIESLQTQLEDLSATPIQKSAAISDPIAMRQIDVDSELFQNSPNPFTDITTIKFTLSENVNQAVIYIFDMIGKQLKSYTLKEYFGGEINIEGGELDAGLYMYSLVADGNVVGTKQMLLTK